MSLQVILEGIGLGVLLVLVCTIGIRKGAVGMVHLYSTYLKLYFSITAYMDLCTIAFQFLG